MASLDQSKGDSLRATVLQIVERLQTDPDFAEEVKADPTATLTSAGLTEEVATNVMRQISTSADVSGYALNSGDLTHSYMWPMGCPWGI